MSDSNDTIWCHTCGHVRQVSEPFWTREPPTEPGWYFAIDKWDCKRIIPWGLRSENMIHPYDRPEYVKYWSREPIVFPAAPKGD